MMPTMRLSLEKLKPDENLLKSSEFVSSMLIVVVLNVITSILLKIRDKWTHEK